ncbi:MAG TPA: tetratricopeptide repeat protein, partial [Moraxellaceae bacterium]
MPRSLRLFTLSLAVLALALAAGCASHKSQKLKSEKEYFEDAQKQMQSGNFSKATTSLEELESHYPVGLYTEQAQLELIYSKFR